MTTRYLSPDEFFALFPDFATKQILGARKGTDPIEANIAVLSNAISKAEALADSYIQVQYVLPLRSVPDVLKAVVGDIARYKLYTEKAPERVDKLYDDAISFLKQVASRKNMLGVPDQASTVAPSAVAVTVRRSRPATDFSGF